ncbi:hypothetical protein ACFY8X_20270 [Streptomyces tanashiensis]|uniref:hypothetical protein n=1 Tax=Streptomyces tanashiensis TaxID=67367 RepID=UPI0033FFFDCC
MAVDDQGRERLQYIDPGDSRCSRLAAELADEWAEYIDATGLSASASRDYVRAAKAQECTQLEMKLKAAATAIAALHHDNEALRAELADRTGHVVVPLVRGP